MTTDDELLTRFHRRLAAIEALVKDPPPRPTRVRGATRIAGPRRSVTPAIGIAGIVILLVAVRLLAGPPTSTEVGGQSSSAAASPPASPTVRPSGSGPALSVGPSAGGGTVIDTLGRFRISHPASWSLVAGPTVADPFGVPIFYLSTEPLTVGPCFTPNPSGEYQGCADPLRGRRLSPNGILVAATPNAGVLEVFPPRVNHIVPPDTGCRSMGADAENEVVVNGTVLVACLRGPDLGALEAGFADVVSSMSASPRR